MIKSNENTPADALDIGEVPVLNPPTRDELIAEISRRKPWYQRIDFPAYGVSTTDDLENGLCDAAFDNQIGGISLVEASLLRPQPKWNKLKDMMPGFADQEILEIGSNCGFFSFEFARAGARRVIGLDVSDHWLDNAKWAAGILDIKNVEFRNVDFMNFSASDSVDVEGLLSDATETIPLPNSKFDIVFMSTVIDHLFFPLFALYKMLRIARKYVIIDTPIINVDLPHGKHALTLGVAPDGSHHGFVADHRFWVTYISRLGLPATDVTANIYNDGHSICLIIDVSNRSRSLWGA